MAPSPWFVPHNSPEYDFPARREPYHAYVVASIPRSGSSLLCTGLWDTGVAGAPHEYFNPVHRRDFQRRWGPGSPDEYARMLLEHRSSPNGVFGLKIHYRQWRPQVNEAGADLDALFEPSAYVAITRRNRVAQAVSLEFARRTRAWTKAMESETAEPVYDAERLAEHVRAIRRWERGWDRFFSDRGIDPLRITYEALAADYPGTLRRALGFLQVPEAAGIEILPPPLRPQDDPANREWIRRFRAEPGP